MSITTTPEKITLKPGTISSGTLVKGHLVHAFLGALPGTERITAIATNHGHTIHLLQNDAVDDFNQEHVDAVDALLEDLTFALENLAPEGYYFGTAEGDGAHFGIFPTIED